MGGGMSPEDLFNMFFGGGGMGGGPFGGGPFGDGGPMFTASFGPGGFRTTRVRQTGRAQGRAAPTVETPHSMFMSLMPLLILLALTLLSALPNLFMETPLADPRFSFQPSGDLNTERHTSERGIRYHVNKNEFTQHPHIAAELAAQRSQNKIRSTDAIKRFETNVEQAYTNHLYKHCNLGMQNRERRKDAEIGFLGINTDWDKVRAIASEKIDACEEGKRLGLLKGI